MYLRTYVSKVYVCRSYECFRKRYVNGYVRSYVCTYVRIRIVVWVCAERTNNCKSFNVPEEWTASIRARRQSPQTTYEPNLNLQVYVRTYASARTDVRMSTYVHIHTCVRTYAYVPPDACVYVRTFADVTNTRAFMFIGAHLLHGHFGFDRYTNACTHANTYVYVYVHAQFIFSRFRQPP